MTPPLDPVACAAFVLLAFVPAGVVHALWLRSSWALRWRTPIDARRTWRGRRLFGDNKTWAGFMVLPPAVGAAFAVFGLASTALPSPWSERIWPLTAGEYGLLGCWTGLGFIAGELPNSFVKRQLGVPPGQAPRGRTARVVGFVIDRIDSEAGAFLAQALVVPVCLEYAVCLLLVAPGLHWLFSVLLFRLGVKGRPS